MGHNVSIDDKNRIVIPKEYEVLDGKEVFYFLLPSKQIIGIYDISQLDGAYALFKDDIKRSQKYTSRKIRNIERKLMGELISVPDKGTMDKERRFLLNGDMLEKLGIEDTAYIDEVENHIEVSKKR